MLLAQVDEDVDEVAAVFGHGARRVHVLVDDLLEEDVELVEDALAAGEEAREAVGEAAGGVGEEVLGGEAGHHVHGVVQHVLETLLVRELLGGVDVPERDGDQT